MKYALIGCGKVAKNHIRAAVKNNLEIVAVCDASSDAMERLLMEAGLGEATSIKRYTDYKELIEKEKPELISIATASGSHAEIALYAIECGVNTIIEKPMAMNISDADRIVEAAERSGVKVSVCHQNRFNPAIQELRRAIESGRFGKLSHGSVHVRWNRNKEYYEQSAWRGTWAEDGGALMNQCIHGIDLLRWMMGEDVDEVYGVTRNQFHDYIEAEDVGMAVVKFKNGAIGTIEGTVNVYPKNLEEALCVFGEKGTVKIGGMLADKIEVWEFADIEGNNEATISNSEEDGGPDSENAESAIALYESGHVVLFADVIDAITTDRKPYVDAVAGRNALEMVLAIYESQRSGKAVKLPL